MQDWRLALRLLAKDRTYTLAAGLTLAVCIGANVAIFTIVDHVVLRPLPFPEADRVLLMANQYPGAGVAVSSDSGVPDYYDRLRETTVFEEQALYNDGNASIEQNGSPTRIRLMNITPSFFRVLRVSPRIGRNFTEAEGEVGADAEVVLSDGLWQSAFGGDPGAVGREIRLDGRPFTVVGVMPEDFTFGDESVRLWRVLAFTAEQKSDDARHNNSWIHIGRLKSGATLELAQQQVDALNARNLERFPKFKEILINAKFHTRVSRLQDNLVRDVKASLFLLWAGALFVLLLGCVNVANLVLVRTSARRRELVTRIALGASRWRIARQLTVETLTLTTISAVAGLLVGLAGLRLLATVGVQDLPRGHEVRVDWAIAIYTFAVSAMIGIVLGAIPIIGLTDRDAASALSEQGRGGTTGRRMQIVRRAFVVAQVAFAFVLLIGAGLLFASFRQVLAVDPGFVPGPVMTASVALPRARYKDNPATIAFMTDALLRLRALPGVARAGVTDTIPFGNNHSDSVILAEGYQMHAGESLISPSQVRVSPGFFEAMGATLVRGRFFDERDTASGPRTVIVDEKLARRFWPGRDPIGRRLYKPTSVDDLFAISDKTVFLTVVGVVHDIRLANMVEGHGEVGAYYFPIDQNTSPALTFAVRTMADPVALTNSIRAAISGVDRELAVFDARTMTDWLDRSLATRRTPMLLSTICGGVALFLSAIGIYGVLGYLVAQRTKEFGIRLALGSTGGGVFRLVIIEGILLIGAGLVVGGAGVAVARRGIESQLFGIRSTDPAVLAGAMVVLAVVATAACVLPARRATRIDPLLALAD